MDGSSKLAFQSQRNHHTQLMNPVLAYERTITRRTFLGQSARGIGRMGLAALLFPDLAKRPPGPHFAPKARRIIYLFQSGGPSHVDLFDYKPRQHDLHATELPNSVRGDQRVTGMTANQDSFPVVAPNWPMRRCGKHGTWISDLLPHTQTIADDICIVKSMVTEAINHDPAITFINTGSQQIGHASLGAWLSYGLGSENENLPAYVVLLSQGSGKNPGQPIFSRLWGNGYLPSRHQGVLLRPGVNPVLYLEDPPGITREQRRRMLDDLAAMNQKKAEDVGSPETLARISAYEMAYRMQTAVPELTPSSHLGLRIY